MRWLALACALLAGCSLVLDEVPIPECTNDDQCAVLGTLEGVPPTCRKFFCSGNGRCAEHPDGTEVCDGHDNDCDGVVDEPDPAGPTIVVSGEPVVTGVADVAHLAWGTDAARTDVAWSSEDRTGFVAGLAGGAPVPLTMVANPTDALNDRTLSMGCWRDDILGGDMLAPCNATELVSVPLGERRLGAAVSTVGCASGLLYAGFVEAEDDRLVVRGPVHRSNSFTGIDSTTNLCTGASRDGCGADGTGARCGAARPALATIDHGPPDCAAGVEICPDRVGQGLLAYLGDGVTRGRCGGPEVDVEALGLHLMIAPVGGPHVWVTASNEGAPQTLGTTEGGGRPAVVAWQERGYFVAYGDAAGRVALHFVPAVAEPPEPADGDPNDRTGQETDPIEVVDLGTLEAMGSAPDHVALSIGAPRDGTLELGVAWLEGCGAGESVVFRRVAVTTSGARATGLGEVSDAVRLSEPAGGDILGTPSLAYQSSGFVVEGFERGGATADADHDGGWIVAWTRGTDGDDDGFPDRGGRMIARRVAELDGLPVDDAERIDLTQADAANAWAPHVEADRFAYWDRAADTVVSGPLACAP